MAIRFMQELKKRLKTVYFLWKASQRGKDIDRLSTPMKYLPTI